MLESLLHFWILAEYIMLQLLCEAPWQIVIAFNEPTIIAN